jgi:hypothetical protein
MTDCEAMKMALEALERGTTGLAIRAIPALRQALAQPEQEPVDIHCPSCLHSFSIVPVAKREWVGLTREEVDAIREDIFKKYQMALSTSKDITSKNNYSAFNFYRAIEAKLKEKNT